mmetsp:Transcript_1652/g.3557  ORF Transcript_1652/g.3557 Transcript_1652/m.3557 type:complete len:261 (-) Transcript_1652:64-846(-)
MGKRTESSHSLKPHSRSSKKTTEKSTKFRGRPKKNTAAYLELFHRIDDKPMKLEVLCNCIIRRMIRKIDNAQLGGYKHDKKLAPLAGNMTDVDNLFRNCISDIAIAKCQWFNDLKRTPKEKNKQFNQKQIKALLESSSLIRDTYQCFVKNLLDCPENVKCDVISLQSWPSDGDEAMRELLFCKEIYGNDVPAEHHMELENCQAEYALDLDSPIKLKNHVAVYESDVTDKPLTWLDISIGPSFFDNDSDVDPFEFFRNTAG